MEDIETRYDIGVDAKVGQIVMVYANAVGRKIVEDVWPEVQWSTDEKFASVNPPDWRFTHIASPNCRRSSRPGCR
jgi:hypothetical protein